MMEFLEKLSPWFEFVWKPGYADYYPELPGGSELGSTINVPAIDLRKLGDEEQNLLAPLALAPKGIWFAPKDLRLFYQVRQNWRGKAVLVKLIWRMFRARVFGDRMAAIGQSLVARMRLALKQQGIPLWLNSPMTELHHRCRRDRDGRGRRTGRPGTAHRCAPRRDPRRPVASTTTWPGAGSIYPCSRRTGASAIPRHGRRHPCRREGWRLDRPARRGLVVSGDCNGPTAGCSSCSTSE